MATMQQILAQIRTAIFGKDVRESIAQGIEKCYDDVTSSETIADAAATRANTAAARSETINQELGDNADDLVIINNNQPALTKEFNKIWIKPDGTEYQVPTWEEFSDLKSAISDSDGNTIHSEDIKNNTYANQYAIVNGVLSIPLAWEDGSISTTTGDDADNLDYKRTRGYTPLFTGETVTNGSDTVLTVIEYNESYVKTDAFTLQAGSNYTITSAENGHYYRFRILKTASNIENITCVKNTGVYNRLSSLESAQDLLFDTYVINPNNIFTGWRLDSSAVTVVDEATIIQGEPTNILLLANTDTPGGKTNCIINIGDAIASGSSGDKYYIHVTLKANRNAQFASKPTVLYFDGCVDSTMRERFYITFYTPSANSSENGYVDYVYEYTRGSYAINKYELWFPIGFDIYIKNMYITKGTDSSPMYRAFEVSENSLYSDEKINISNWAQGWIRTDGAFGKSNEDCISGYLYFHGGTVNLNVKTGYKIKVAQYSDNIGTFDEFVIDTYATGTVTFNAIGNKYYRIDLQNSAETSITPQQIPSDCIAFYQETPTDRTLTQKWRSADSYVVGQQFLDLSYNDPYKLLLEKGIFIGDSTTAGANWDENGNYDSSDPTTSLLRGNYPYYFSKLSDCVATNAGRSGGGAKTWWNEQKDTHDFSQYDFVIINLGTNYGLTDTLSEDTSAASYLDYANTNTGSYCKIIEKILSENAHIHIFLAYPQCRSGLVEDGETAAETNINITCSVIAQIAQKYSLPILDDRMNYKVSCYQSNDNVHMTRLGYNMRAKTYLNQIVEYIKNNPSDFKTEY